MIAILLCAGFATRMYPMTRDFPKPLLPVADKPVLDYLMDQIIDLEGLREIHLVSNTRFFKHFDNWRSGWQTVLQAKKIQFKFHNDGVTESENRLGAVGDLHFVMKRLSPSKRYLVSAGDNIYRFRLKPLWKHFLKRKAHYIIGLPETDHARLQKTGVLTLNNRDRVLRLHEKPRNPASTWCCPPLYFLQKSARQTLEDYVQVSNRYDASGSFINFLSRQEAVFAFKPAGGRLDIGSRETYREADRRLRKESIFLSKSD